MRDGLVITRNDQVFRVVVEFGYNADCRPDPDFGAVVEWERTDKPTEGYEVDALRVATAYLQTEENV